MDQATQARQRKDQDSLQSLAESPFLPAPQLPIPSPSCQPSSLVGQGTALHLTTWPALALWPRSKLGNVRTCLPAVLGLLGLGVWPLGLRPGPDFAATICRYGAGLAATLTTAPRHVGAEPDDTATFKDTQPLPRPSLDHLATLSEMPQLWASSVKQG